MAVAVRHRSPIEPHLLEPACAPFGASRGLPGEAYVSACAHAWEVERLMAGSWACLGRAPREPGDRCARRIAGEGVVLVRGEDHRLRGFVNACRHRGHELLAQGETASGRAIRCPYHGWAYGLRGELLGAPGFRDRPGFEKAEHGLRPVTVAEWNGWAFANLSGAAASFDAHVGALSELVTPYGCAELVVGETVTYEVAANWKLLVENYLECYHCPSIHPELCRVQDPRGEEDFSAEGEWIGGASELRPDAETMSLTGRSAGTMLPGLSPAQRRRILYFYVRPNLLLSLHPDYVMAHRIDALGPDRTGVECAWLFPPEVVARGATSYATEFWDRTNRQDWHACESVQRGVSSAAYEPGPLADAELATYQFIRTIAGCHLAGR